MDHINEYEYIIEFHQVEELFDVDEDEAKEFTAAVCSNASGL